MGITFLTCTPEIILAAGTGRSVTTVVPCLRLSVMGGTGDTSVLAPLLPASGFWDPWHSAPCGTEKRLCGPSSPGRGVADDRRPPWAAAATGTPRAEAGRERGVLSWAWPLVPPRRVGGRPGEPAVSVRDAVPCVSARWGLAAGRGPRHAPFPQAALAILPSAPARPLGTGRPGLL